MDYEELQRLATLQQLVIQARLQELNEHCHVNTSYGAVGTVGGHLLVRHSYSVESQ
jgi:hypothetical protein